MGAASGARVLVAGGGGFLGRAITTALVDAGHDVHATWRRTRPAARSTTHRADLDDPDHVARVISQARPDVVVLALGGPHRPLSAGDRIAAWRDAPIATNVVLDACRGHDVHIVALASSHVFAASDRPIAEDALIEPVSLRGVAGHAADECIRLWAAETGASATILRPFSVYGPGEPPDRVIPTLLRAALHSEPFATTTEASGRDFVYVDDIADAVVRACQRTVTGSFNLGTGVGTSVPELVRIVESVTGAEIDVRAGEFEPRPWDRRVWVADPTRAADELGWRATTSLHDGIRRMVT